MQKRTNSEQSENTQTVRISGSGSAFLVGNTIDAADERRSKHGDAIIQPNVRVR